MQNRRIVDKQLAESGHTVTPMLEANSTIALLSHVRTGKWASVVANTLADVFAFPDSIRSIPIEGPEVSHQMGLVVLDREPIDTHRRRPAHRGTGHRAGAFRADLRHGRCHARRRRAKREP